MANNSPLCKGIESVKGSIFESELWKKQRMHNGAFLKSLSIDEIGHIKGLQGYRKLAIFLPEICDKLSILLPRICHNGIMPIHKGYLPVYFKGYCYPPPPTHTLNKPLQCMCIL